MTIKGAGINENRAQIGHQLKNILYATISNPNKTGDWLIYEKYDWGNYYISLAQHEERDIEIYDRIKNYIGKFNS